MNPLRSLETMIANLVEGSFGRLFRSEVRPMEIARKLTREMDAGRTVSVSRTYAPNEYAVWLSAEDRAHYEGVEGDLIDELCAYLLEHARREDLVLAAPLDITFHTDERLVLGEFGIEARLVRAQEHDAPEHEEEPDSGEWVRPPSSPPPQAPAAPPSAPAQEHGQTLIYSSSQRVREPIEDARSRRSTRALLLFAGRRLLVPPRGAIVGRSRECDIVVEDAGVSRQHAEIRPDADGWTLRDMGSTNGVRVNGQKLRGTYLLAPGDRVELGSTEIVFEVR